LFARRCRAGQCEDPSANNCTDTDAGESEWAKNALHLPLRRGSFGHQMVRAFLSEKFKSHGARSCHQPLCLVNPNFSMSILQGGSTALSGDVIKCAGSPPNLSIEQGTARSTRVTNAVARL